MSRATVRMTFQDGERSVSMQSKRGVRRSVSRSLAMIIVMGVSVVGWLSLVQTPADAASPNVVTFNFCVLTASSCSGTGEEKANHLVDLLEARDALPLAIVLQEVCSHTSFVEMKDWAIANGYRAQFSKAKNGCGNNEYGNAVLWKGGCHGAPSGSDVTSNASCLIASNYSGSTTRGYVCVRAALPDFGVCNTHLESSSASTAIGQLSDFYDVSYFLGTAGGYRAVFAGGDLNLTPAQHPASANPFYVNGWKEADTHVSPYYRFTTDSGKKLDYLFAAFRCTQLDASIDGSSMSDHHHYGAYYKTC